MVRSRKWIDLPRLKQNQTNLKIDSLLFNDEQLLFRVFDSDIHCSK